MDRSEFREILTHMEWADAHSWRAVRTLDQALSDERLKYLFHHVHLVQWVYLQSWRGDPFQLTELTGFSDLAAIEAWAKPYYRLASEYAASVDDSKFSQPIEFSWSQLIADKYGKVIPATLSESAWQVFSHTTYHRGQIAMRIRELGGEPPLVDFLVWVWSGKPAPDWAAE
jgi:uncharacterized damage-inducible protein DinB